MSYTNRWTSGDPKTGSTIKLVLAERVYYAPADTAYADPTAKLSGADAASPWVDLGIVKDSKVNVTYNKDTAFIETGIDKIRRGAYLKGKNASAKFSLEQVDITALEALTGQTAASVGSPVIGKKIYVGTEDVVEKALLFVGTNKVDGKEWHTYSKKSAVTFGFAEDGDSRVIEVTADLYGFDPDGVGAETNALYVLYILS